MSRVVAYALTLASCAQAQPSPASFSNFLGQSQDSSPVLSERCENATAPVAAMDPPDCNDPRLSTPDCTAQEQALLKNCLCPVLNDVNLTQMMTLFPFLMQQAEKCILKPNTGECDQVVQETLNKLQTCRDAGDICKLGMDIYADFPMAGLAILEMELCVPKACHEYKSLVSQQAFKSPKLQMVCPSGNCELPIQCGADIVGKRWNPAARAFGSGGRRLQTLALDTSAEGQEVSTDQAYFLAMRQIPGMPGQMPGQMPGGMPGQMPGGMPDQSSGPMIQILSPACMTAVSPVLMGPSPDCTDSRLSSELCTANEQDFLRNCACELVDDVKAIMKDGGMNASLIMQQANKCVVQPNGDECEKIVGETKGYLQKCRDSGDVCKVGADLLFDFGLAAQGIAQAEMCLPQGCHSYKNWLTRKLTASLPPPLNQVCMDGACTLPVQCGQDVVGKVWDAESRTFVPASESSPAENAGGNPVSSTGGGGNGAGTVAVILLVLLLISGLAVGVVMWRKKANGVTN